MKSNLENPSVFHENPPNKREKFSENLLVKYEPDGRPAPSDVFHIWL